MEDPRAIKPQIRAFRRVPSCASRCYPRPMNAETLEISISSLEDHPEQTKLEFCKQELRAQMSVSAISANTYSQLLARLHQVKVRLRGGAGLGLKGGV